MALLNDLKMVQKDYPLNIIGHLEGVCDFNDGTAWVVLAQKFVDAPTTHERRCVHHDYYWRMVLPTMSTASISTERLRR